MIQGRTTGKSPAMRSTGFAVSPAAKWAGAATIFLAISRSHLHFGVLLTTKAFTLVNALAVVLLLASASRWRPGDLKKHWIPKMIGFLLLIAIVGGPFALYPGRALAFLQDAYIRVLIIGLIAWAIARTPAGARFMARVIVLAGLATIILALHVNGINTTGRLEGAYTYDPNDLALISLVTLPLVVWWITDPASRFGKWLVLSIPIILWVIVRTDSRGGFLGLVAISLGFVILGFKWAPGSVKKVGRLVVMGLIVGLFFAPESYMERMEGIADDDDYNRTSPTGRVEVWKRGLGYTFSNPFLGVGLDNYTTAEGTLSEQAQSRASRGIGWKWSTARNSFLQVAVELGLFAGIVFLVLVVRTTFTLLLWFRDRERVRGPPAPPDLLAPFLGLSFLGYGVTGFFLSFAYYEILYVLFGLACALMLADQRVRESRKVPRQIHRARSRSWSHPQDALSGG